MSLRWLLRTLVTPAPAFDERVPRLRTAGLLVAVVAGATEASYAATGVVFADAIAGATGDARLASHARSVFVARAAPAAVSVAIAWPLLTATVSFLSLEGTGTFHRTGAAVGIGFVPWLLTAVARPVYAALVAGGVQYPREPAALTPFFDWFLFGLGPKPVGIVGVGALCWQCWVLVGAVRSLEGLDGRDLLLPAVFPVAVLLAGAALAPRPGTLHSMPFVISLYFLGGGLWAAVFTHQAVELEKGADLSGYRGTAEAEPFAETYSFTRAFGIASLLVAFLLFGGFSFVV